MGYVLACVLTGFVLAILLLAIINLRSGTSSYTSLPELSLVFAFAALGFTIGLRLATVNCNQPLIVQTVQTKQLGYMNDQTTLLEKIKGTGYVFQVQRVDVKLGILETTDTVLSENSDVATVESDRNVVEVISARLGNSGCLYWPKAVRSVPDTKYIFYLRGENILNIP